MQTICNKINKNNKKITRMVKTLYFVPKLEKILVEILVEILEQIFSIIELLCHAFLPVNPLLRITFAMLKNLEIILENLLKFSKFNIFLNDNYMR